MGTALGASNDERAGKAEARLGLNSLTTTADNIYL